MPDPLTAAHLKAATLLTEAARSLGSSAVCPVRSVRFRPDGKGGELAAPFPMTAHLDAGALAQAVSADAFFERAAPSGAWIALELSEEWRDAAGYDLSLDSEQLCEDGCVALIQKLLPLFT